MYHNLISRKINIQDSSNNNINNINNINNKIKMNEIIIKMVQEEDKYEDYYIYKDIFEKLYKDISEIEKHCDISHNYIIPTYEVSETDYKYFKTTKKKNIMDIMINKK